MKKICFFDIDGTLTSEIDGSIPESVFTAIRKARENGHLMFINTGRCYQNVEKRFQDIGFDGIICGCGTDIFYQGKELLYISQSHETTLRIIHAARECGVDLLLEARNHVAFDLGKPLMTPTAQEMYHNFCARGYNMPTDFEDPAFTCDKFVIWFEQEDQLTAFRKVSDPLFTCIDRGGNFREFVPLGYSKATGIHFILEKTGIAPENAYAFGDSNNDLPMLTCLQNSVAMGNSYPKSLFKQVSYVTKKASEDGILLALEHFDFL